MACVFGTRPAPRRPHDVIHPPGGRSSERPAPGPRAENKWCTASLVRSPEQVIADAFDLAQAHAPKHLRPWIVLVDGARHQLDLITAESIRRGVTLHVLLDFVHVAEDVWAAAHTFHKPGTTEAKEWAADHLTAILAGHAARTADQMTAQADREDLSIARREAVDACQRYLVGHLDPARSGCTSPTNTARGRSHTPGSGTGLSTVPGSASSPRCSPRPTRRKT